MSKLLKFLVLIPLGIGFVALAIANRAPVSLSFDPISMTEPFFALKAPFFVFLFASLMIGVLIGGFSTWLTQGRHRKAARMMTRETTRLKAEMADVKARSATPVSSLVQLPPRAA